MAQQPESEKVKKYCIKISQKVVPNQRHPGPGLRLKFHGREKYQELTLLYLREATDSFDGLPVKIKMAEGSGSYMRCL